jgi:hypothetical protein
MIEAINEVEVGGFEGVDTFSNSGETGRHYSFPSFSFPLIVKNDRNQLRSKSSFK